MIRDDACEFLTTNFAGPGAYGLGGARSARYVRFRDRFADGAAILYAVATDDAQPVANGPKRERGIGVLTYGSTDTISRARIIRSSNNDAAVNWVASDRPVIFSFASLDALAGVLGSPRLVSGASAVVTANDIGIVFCFDVSAGNGLLSLPTIAALFPFFRVGVLGFGSAVNYVAVTPDAADAINDGGDGVAKNVIGRTGETWFNVNEIIGGWSTG